MLGRRSYLLKRLKGIRNQIDSILLSEAANISDYLDPSNVMEIVSGIAFKYETFINHMIPNFLQEPLLRIASFDFRLRHNEAFRRAFLDDLNRILAIVPTPKEERAIKEAAEESKGIIKRAWESIRDVVSSIGGPVRDRLYGFYSTVETFARSNPFLAGAIFCFILLVLVCYSITRDGEMVRKLSDSFSNALTKVWESIKSSWYEEGISPKIIAALKLIFMPFSVMSEVLSDQNLESFDKVFSLFSIFSFLLLLGFVYYKYFGPGAGTVA